MFDHEDICAAHSAGHEIACHTYSHLDCGASPKRSILAEIDDNAAALSSVLGGSAPTFIRMTSSRCRRHLGARQSSWRLSSPTPQTYDDFARARCCRAFSTAREISRKLYKVIPRRIYHR
jgi:peptidoglycan/xylan/chitin deacetylase (PgdA/CDA1 family)